MILESYEAILTLTCPTDKGARTGVTGTPAVALDAVCIGRYTGDIGGGRGGVVIAAGMAG